jgi:threonine dehydratase
MFDPVPAIATAADRIRPYVRETSLEHSLYFSQQTGNTIWLKLEHLQHTGSFKVRGAMNKLLALPTDLRDRGVVAASSGNHGAAVAYGLYTLHLPGVIFVPTHAAPTKVATIHRFGIDVRFHGDDTLDTEVFARHYADQLQIPYISPYNDWDVICGQGTLAVELMQQHPHIDAIFVAVGGGGLIAGIASYVKAHIPRSVEIIGCLPERSPVMAASVQAGHIVEVPMQPTLSDGTAGGIEPDAITFDLCRALVDQYILVSETEIQAAIRLMLEMHHQVIEGAAGVALAAYLKSHHQWKGRNIAIILCGANISLAGLKDILC